MSLIPVHLSSLRVLHVLTYQLIAYAVATQNFFAFSNKAEVLLTGGMSGKILMRELHLS